MCVCYKTVICAHEMTVVCAVKEVACTFYVFLLHELEPVDNRKCIK